MEILKIIIPILPQLAWPLAAVILCTIFRKQLAKLIDRTEKVGVDGLQTTTKAQEQSNELIPSKTEELLKTYLNSLLLEQVEILKQELDKTSLIQKEREDILLKALASNQITLTFEKTYYLIFGSQIEAIQQLVGAPDFATDINYFVQIYEHAKSKFPELYKDFSFESWLHFLVHSVLIRVENQKIAITVRGKEFLKYVIDQGHSLIKFG